jgi:predicted anti-sigma-YlaC factor YlaD
MAFRTGPMDCKRILEELNLYIDGELERELCEQLEVHLKGCDRCRIVLDTTRKTIQFYQDQTPLDLPAGVRDRLHAALRSRWKKQ